MPLWLLGPLVVGGVVLVVLASHLLGWSAPARLDADTARARWLVDHPETAVQDVAVAADGSAALLWLGDHGALVFAVGDRLATRSLRHARVRSDGDGLIVAFGDLATPDVRVAVADAVWRQRLGVP